MLGRWLFANIFDIVRVFSRFRTAESLWMRLIEIMMQRAKSDFRSW